MGKAATIKTRCIKRLNALLGDTLVYQAGDTYIIADDEGHWSITHRYDLSTICIGIWDEARESSPTWKIVWGILENIK